MQRLLSKLAAVIAVGALIAPGLVLAQTQPWQGGTGTIVVPTNGQILIAQPNGKYLPQDPSVLGSIVAASAWPWPNNATTTILRFTNGLISAASSTFGADVQIEGTLTLGALTGLLKASSGVVSTAVSNTDYQAPITLTTTGSSGAATFNGTTLNIPQYATFAYPFPSNATSTSIAFNGGLTGVLTGSLVGNASTATALAANGGNCSAGSYPLGVDASGAVETCTSTLANFITYLAATTSVASITTLQNLVISASQITGVLGVPSGGTGNGSYTAGHLIVGNGTSAFASIATSTGTCAGGTSCSPFVVVGTVAPVITSFSYPFPSNATTTVINFSAGALMGSSTIGILNATSSATIASTTLTGNTLMSAATSSAFAITGIASGNLLKTTTGGAIIPAVAGTDYLTAANIFAYPFPSNATTTLIAFNGGLSSASTTLTGNFVFNTATGTSATTTNLYSSGYTRLGSLTGVLIGSTGVVSTGVDGTDFTLLNAITCTNQALTAFTAAGVGTCSSITDSFISGTIGVAHGGTASSSLGGILAGGGTSVYSVATSTPSTGTGISVTGTGAVLGSLTINNTGVTSNVAGAGISVSGATGAVIITNTIGYPFPSNATTTLIAFNGGLTSASTTLTGPFVFANATGTNATTTNLAVTGTASTSKFYADGLVTCNTGNMLTWAAGTFGCEDDTSSVGGGSFPFTPQTYGNSTSTLINFTNGIMATGSSTVQELKVTNGTTTNSTSTTAYIASNLVVGDGGSIRLDNGDTGTGVTLVGAQTPGTVTATFPMTTGTVALGTGSTNTFAYWTGTNTLAATTTPFFANYYAVNGTTTNATSTTLNVSGQVDFDGLTSAIVTAGATGILGEYAGADCTNQFVRDLSALGAPTCDTIQAADVSLANLSATDSTVTFSGTYTGATARTIGINLANANTWTSLQTINHASTTNLTVGSFLKIPTATSFSNFAQGGIYYDTTSGNGLLGTTTATHATDHVVIFSATSTLYAFSIASSSPYFFDTGKFKELPSHPLAQVATHIWCKVSGGTSKVINLSDTGSNDTNAITCTTTGTQFALTSNNSFTSYEAIRLEMGATTGVVDDVIIRVLGYRTTN